MTWDEQSYFVDEGSSPVGQTFSCQLCGYTLTLAITPDYERMGAHLRTWHYAEIMAEHQRQAPCPHATLGEEAL